MKAIFLRFRMASALISAKDIAIANSADIFYQPIC
jgi:hypothetical protein